MADDVEVSLDDVRRYLEYKNAAHGCPMCGHNDWMISDDPEQRLLHLPSTNTAIGTVPQNLPLGGQPLGIVGDAVVVHFPALAVVPIICGNCGLSQMFSAAWILRWIKEHAADVEAGHG